jgi:hypothetical protein
MRPIVLAAALLFAACEKSEPPAATPTAPSPLPSVTALDTPARPRADPVEGWETSGGELLLLGKLSPAFNAPGSRAGATAATSESIRGRWTIVALLGAQAPLPGNELTYLQALKSAVDADPDLDFLPIHAPGANFAALAPTFTDDGSVSKAFGVETYPTYLLVGPDLTIEAYRKALSADPDGIKSVIRGVAEIKKQVAAPDQK